MMGTLPSKLSMRISTSWLFLRFGGRIPFGFEDGAAAA